MSNVIFQYILIESNNNLSSRVKLHLCLVIPLQNKQKSKNGFCYLDSVIVHCAGNIFIETVSK